MLPEEPKDIDVKLKEFSEWLGRMMEKRPILLENVYFLEGEDGE